MDIAADDFSLFGLPRRFSLGDADLAATRRALQAQAHPDRHATAGASAQRVAMQWSARINEAYARLGDPLARATLLCALYGTPVDPERNTAMPARFLEQQMRWREALDDAGCDRAALVVLAGDVGARRDEGLAAIERALDDEHDPAAAAAEVRALMFVDRFADDVEERLYDAGSA